MEVVATFPYSMFVCRYGKNNTSLSSVLGPTSSSTSEKLSPVNSLTLFPNSCSVCFGYLLCPLRLVELFWLIPLIA